MSRDPEFDRPVIIISAPRSGSTLLFETLAQAQNVYTIGTESFNVIEGVRALNPATRGLESHRLDAEAASDEVVRALRARLRAALFDRHGTKPRTAQTSRSQDQTWPNAVGFRSSVCAVRRSSCRAWYRAVRGIVPCGVSCRARYRAVRCSRPCAVCR